MATTIELTPDTVNQLTKILVDSFRGVSESMAKEISQKAITVANKKTELTLNEAAKKGSFVNPFNKFLEKTQKTFKEGGMFGLTKEFLSSLKSIKEENKLQKSILPQALKNIIPTPEKPKTLDLIKDEEKPQKVLIDGITEIGYRDLIEKMPNILKNALPEAVSGNENKRNKDIGGNGLLSLLPSGLISLLKGALMGGGGIALLLGGLAALITGLETEGPWKGTLKILSKLGLSGGLNLVQKGIVKFLEGFKSITTKISDLFVKVKDFFKPLTDKIVNFFKPFKDTILNLFNSSKDKLSGIFSSLKDKVVSLFKPLTERVGVIFSNLSDNILKFVSGIGDSITNFFKGGVIEKGLGITGKLISGGKGIFAGMFAKIVKFIKPIAKRIPVLGTVIGLGFAYSRFKSGDTIGGIIDVLSAIATLVPFAGTAVSIGLDVLNAFLDYKMGGANAEAGVKKTQMVGDFFGGIWKWIKEKISNIFSWFTDLGSKLISGKWGEAFEQIAGWIPGLDWVLGFLGTDKESLIKAANIQGENNVDMIGNLMKWMKESIWEKVTGFANNLIGSVKDWWGGVVDWWKGDNSTPPMPESKEDIKNKMENELGLAEGGIVKKPIKSWIGEAGPEAVIPLDQYMSPAEFKISNELLQSIASNTSNTNDTIKNLSQAILKLAVVFDKKQTGANNVVITGQNQPQYPTAAQIASSNIDPIRQIRMQFAV